MMKQEFEEIAGYEVRTEVYDNIIEPMYMALPDSITKQEFVKMLNRKQFEYKRERKADYKRMCVRNRMGDYKTPNGCYYYIQYVDLVGVDIKKGRYIVRRITEKEEAKLRAQGNNTDYATDYDIDYLMCEDEKHRDIELRYE